MISGVHLKQHSTVYIMKFAERELKTLKCTRFPLEILSALDSWSGSLGSCLTLHVNNMLFNFHTLSWK